MLQACLPAFRLTMDIGHDLKRRYHMMDNLGYILVTDKKSGYSSYASFDFNNDETLNVSGLTDLVAISKLMKERTADGLRKMQIIDFDKLFEIKKRNKGMVEDIDTYDEVYDTVLRSYIMSREAESSLERLYHQELERCRAYRRGTNLRFKCFNSSSHGFALEFSVACEAIDYKKNHTTLYCGAIIGSEAKYNKHFITDVRSHH